MKVSSIFIAAFLCFHSVACEGEQRARPFTVADEIGLAYFGDPYDSFSEEAVRVSPDGNYFAVDAVRGRLDLNSIEDSLRFYRGEDIQNFLNHPHQSTPPLPVWIVNRSGKEAPIINPGWRWLPDSSGVAFLEGTSVTNRRLFLADLRKKTVQPLTSTTQMVQDFDVRDRQHYVYSAIDSARVKKIQSEPQAPATVGTGRSLWDLIFPDDPVAVRQSRSYTNPTLWAVVGGKRFEVKHDGKPIVSKERLAISPDGNSVVTVMPVLEVPASWENLYLPPYESSHYRIHAGHQDAQSDSVHQYVRIDLQRDSVQSLTDAPLSYDAEWWAFGDPSWSSDGQEILLPGTFLNSMDSTPSRPCIAIVDLSSNTRTCVWRIRGRTGPSPEEVEEGYHVVQGARFLGKDKNRVIVLFQDHEDGSYRSIEYRRTTDGMWQVAAQSKDVAAVGHNDLEVAVKQSLNEPPRLIATNKQISRVIWDPNSQLKNIDLGVASVYKWKDKNGRDLEGGLYKPSNYKLGQRYPLVIQTHGFMRTLFFPSGLFPTANAARALAAAGIAVLQVGDVGDCPFHTSDEGPCYASGYEAVAKQLVSEGMVDPDRIGIIGFSRTCFYVMQSLTFGKLRFKAASITDGVMESYLQYMTQVDAFGNSLAHDANSVIGAEPFGEGLRQWMKVSVGFNLDKVQTPLLIVGTGATSLLFMWEPYAGLRYLQKPVDLVMLHTDEHVLTNPTARLASQGGSVDWFRFWLQDWEDPDPTKAEQYARWRELRKLQEKIEQERSK